MIADCETSPAKHSVPDPPDPMSQRLRKHKTEHRCVGVWSERPDHNGKKVVREGRDWLPAMTCGHAPRTAVERRKGGEPYCDPRLSPQM